MTKFLIIVEAIVVGTVALFAVYILFFTILQTKQERENCEQFRLTVIQDVPKSCFEYFQKEYK